MTAEPFTVSVEDAVLLDVRDRLRRTRWPVEPDAAPWKLGASLDYMKRVAAYWADATTGDGRRLTSTGSTTTGRVSMGSISISSWKSAPEKTPGR